MSRPLTWMDYFETDAGITDRLWQEAVFSRFASRKLGDYALQLGLPEIATLRASPIPVKLLASDRCTPTQNTITARLLTAEDALALETESVDIVLWPHGLDREKEAKETLAEIVRVLNPNGVLLTTFFNASGIWSLEKKFRRISPIPDFAYPVRTHEAKKALTLAGLTIEGGAYGVYGINTKTEKSCIEKAGDRWWPTMSNLVLLQARKNTASMKLVGKVAFKKQPSLSVLPQTSQKTLTEGSTK